MSDIPAYAVLIGTGVILTYLPKVLSGAMDSIGGASGFKRAAMAVTGAAVTGGTSLAAGAAARGAGSVAASAAGRAAASGNMSRAAKLTRVASLSNKAVERTGSVTRSSFRQMSNTFKDEAGLGGLTPLPYDDIGFRGRASGPRSAGSTGQSTAPAYQHAGPRGVEEGHLHNEVFQHGTEAAKTQAAQATRMQPIGDAAARRYVDAYKARSIALQNQSDLDGQPPPTDARTPVASPLGWKEAPDKANPKKKTNYYEAPKIQSSSPPKADDGTRGR
jgi:hypothetical protein